MGISSDPEIRKRQIAKLTPWKKGQSGNPAGRPHNPLRITSALRDMLDQPVPDEIKQLLVPPRLRKRLTLKSDITWKELLAMRAVLKGAGGDITAIREIADRDEGKPKQRLEVTGAMGNEISIKVVMDEPVKKE